VARKISRGLRAIRWIEDYCRIPEGQFVGQKVKLRPWQKKVIRGIYDTPTRTAIISFWQEERQDHAKRIFVSAAPSWSRGKGELATVFVRSI
jgi:hypothetical protein